MLRHAILILTIFFLFVSSISGCRKSRPKTIQVKGHVTLNGGKWPGAGNIFFRTTKAAPGHIERPGYATFDAEGNFTAGTYDSGDGLIPGEYDVLIRFTEGGGADAKGNAPPKAISATDKLKVPADSEPIEYSFDVKKK